MNKFVCSAIILTAAVFAGCIKLHHFVICGGAKLY